MATDVSNYIRLSIPSELLHDGEVQARVDELTKYIGGSTVVEGRGVWLDGDGTTYAEHVLVHQWNFGASKFPRAETLSRAIVAAMFAHGEQCVFKEREYNVNGKTKGYRARLLYPTPIKH